MLNFNKYTVSDEFYNKLENDVIPLDIYTAASLGDISFFTKFDIGKLPSILSHQNSSGWTPLMYACSRGHSLLVNYLLMSGAQRNCKTKSGITPLMLAVSSGDILTVEAICDVSNLEDKDYRLWTPLFFAVHFTREKCVNYLLKRGANVNIVDYQNETPLIVAIKLGRETMVELLLKRAKNLEVVSYKQESALMLADESTNKKITTMVRNHYELLNNPQISGSLEHKVNITPTRELKVKSFQHCSPTPIKEQIKSQLPHIKMSKSMRYSPNKKTIPLTPKQNTDSSPVWKVLIQKKFWSPQLRRYNDVEQFLKMLGLEKYWPIFRDEEVDFETLMTLDEENLKELGIQLFGPRKKIFLAIQQLRYRH